ncbi:hypothetical protein QOT17_017734 [Balamuthia mandrillaris]
MEQPNKDKEKKKDKKEKKDEKKRTDKKGNGSSTSSCNNTAGYWADEVRLDALPIFETLKDCESVLLAGCGGGYDVFSGLPLYFALQKMGKKVHLANLCFTDLALVTGKRFADICIEVTADTVRENVRNYSENFERVEYYFPELYLSKWFRQHEQQEVPIYTFPRSGVQPTLKVYKALVEHLQLDAIVLVDGGTDSLMRGDEQLLGTPVEDMQSIAAVRLLEEEQVKRKVMACIGFGVDAFHGVCHSRFLENVATLSKQGAFLGTLSVLPQHVEAQKFIHAYEHCSPSNSIVCASVVSAVRGEFGDYHHPATKQRTASSTLFINPLMSMYWFFHLDQVADNVHYLHLLKDTTTSYQVQRAISEFRQSYNPKLPTRQDISFPH